MQELRLRQQMTLAPRLQQSVKLLQMSALEFTTAVELALASNPFLEEVEEQVPDPAQDATEPTAPPVGDPSEPETPAGETTQVTLEPPATTPEYSGDYPVPSRGDGEDHDLSQWASAPVSMREKLSLELGNYRLGPRDRLLAEFIIDALDEDGYLRTPTANLCNALSADFTPRRMTANGWRRCAWCSNWMCRAWPRAICRSAWRCNWRPRPASTRRCADWRWISCAGRSTGSPRTTSPACGGR